MAKAEGWVMRAGLKLLLRPVVGLSNVQWSIVTGCFKSFLDGKNEITPALAAAKTIIAISSREEVDTLNLLAHIAQIVYAQVVLGKSLDALEVGNDT